MEQKEQVQGLPDRRQRDRHPRKAHVLVVAGNGQATGLRIQAPAATVHEVPAHLVHHPEAVDDHIGIELAIPDAALDPGHALRTGICRAHLEADVLLLGTLVHDAASGRLVHAVGQLLHRVVHAAHDGIAGEEKRHRQLKRGVREQLPVVRMDVVVVRLANAKPVPIMTGSSKQDKDGALRQVRLFPDPVEDGEHLLPAKLPVCVTGAADHVRDGLNGHMASF